MQHEITIVKTTFEINEIAFVLTTCGESWEGKIVDEMGNETDIVSGHLRFTNMNLVKTDRNYRENFINTIVIPAIRGQMPDYIRNREIELRKSRRILNDRQTNTQTQINEYKNRLTELQTLMDELDIDQEDLNDLESLIRMLDGEFQK